MVSARLHLPCRWP